MGGLLYMGAADGIYGPCRSKSPTGAFSLRGFKSPQPYNLGHPLVARVLWCG